MSVEIQSRDLIWIVGKKMSGKSHLLKKMLNIIPNYVVWDNNWEHSEKGKVTHDLNKFKRLIKRKKKRVIYQPRDKGVEHFDKWCKEINKLHNCFIVVEEIERYGTSHFAPDSLRELIDIGRFRYLGQIFTSRRPKRIWGDIPYNADHIFVFRMTRPQELIYMAEWVGNEVYALKDKPEYWYVHYDSRDTYLKPPV